MSATNRGILTIFLISFTSSKLQLCGIYGPGWAQYQASYVPLSQFSMSYPDSSKSLAAFFASDKSRPTS